jgi:hypothetical protein
MDDGGLLNDGRWFHNPADDMYVSCQWPDRGEPEYLIKWNALDESTPPEGCRVLISTASEGELLTVIARRLGGEYYLDTQQLVTADVIAWADLLEPWDGKGPEQVNGQ